MLRILTNILLAAFLCGCSNSGNSPDGRVVIYTSLDQPHSAPVLERFEERTGIRVDAVYDTEASKTVGLVNRLIAEKRHPRADVFWNSEVLRTIVLKRKGVLSPYRSPAAAGIPERFKDPEGYWCGFAARTRVLLVNRDRVKGKAPESVDDLTKEEWRGRFAIANPLFGTTATQAAAWRELWGEERAEAFLLALKENGAVVAAGNAMARDMVAAGEIEVCLTDTDDAYGAIRRGRPVEMIYPDQGEGEEGTLFIPNTVCLIKGGPNPEAGKKLIDFLLSPEVEEMLAFSESAQIPLRDEVRRPEHVLGIDALTVQEVDFERVADVLEESAVFIRDVFLK